MNMQMIEGLSLVAGTLTMSAPAIQAWQTIKSRNIVGLSANSYVLLVILNMLAVLIGIQYSVVAIIALNGLSLIFYALTLYMISARAMLSLAGAVALLASALAIVVPAQFQLLFTTRWSEQTGFVYGIVACLSFLPQVVLTRRTGDASALSVINLSMLLTGLLIWILVCVLLGNWSLTLWNGVLALAVADLLRLKLSAT